MTIEAWELMGRAIGDYWRGNRTAALMVCSDFAGAEEYPARIFFRNEAALPELEQYALSLCRGRILDIGAGAGCHSLILARNHLAVTALDIAPEAVAVMRQRGLADVVCGDIREFRAEPFDTVLMLMNGIGMAEDLSGLRKLFAVLRRPVKPGGQLLLDSADLKIVAAAAKDPKDFPRQTAAYYGEITYRIEYCGLKSEPFRWLYLDQRTLRKAAAGRGWECQIIYEEGGQYLARLT